MWQSFVDQMDKHVAVMKNMMNTHKGPPADGAKHEHAPANPKE
jgi:hypothetical protein